MMDLDALRREAGCCPECHIDGPSGGATFDGKEVWYICQAHRVKWHAPAVLTKVWADEFKEHGAENTLLLATYATVEPWRGETEILADPVFEQRFQRMMGGKV